MGNIVIAINKFNFYNHKLVCLGGAKTRDIT